MQVLRAIVVTSNRPRAGANPRVYISIYDENGNATELIKLDKPGNNFKKGSTDTFGLQPDQTSALKERPVMILLTRADSSKLDSWHLDSISLQTKDGTMFDFPVGKWIVSGQMYKITASGVTNDPPEEPVPDPGDTAVHKVCVRTGDHKGAGGNPRFYIIIHDASGNITEPIRLKSFFSKGSEQHIMLKPKHTNVLKDVPSILDVTRQDSSKRDTWYLETVTLLTGGSTKFVFPVNRWIESGRIYRIPHLDTSLPQDEPFPDLRTERLHEAREIYRLADGAAFPARIADVPPQEEFSKDYMKFLVGVTVDAALETFAGVVLKPLRWKSLHQLEQLFTDDLYYQPACVDHWWKDWWFGAQRLAGVDPTVIRLCEAIPPNMDATDADLNPFLEGQTVDQAIKKNRLFICDLQDLDGLRSHNGRVLPAPIALFYVNSQSQLMPIAIQLFPTKGDPNNPVFFPNDDPIVWRLAKMWYNLAEANAHQAGSHLHLTHLVMESFSLATHRELAGNHPIFRLLKPHFLFLFNINKLADEKLLSDGGLFDATFAIGANNVRVLGAKRLEHWRMNVEGTLPKALEERGVLDKNVLPGYFYRDDALLLYNAVKEYVRNYVNQYYSSDDKVLRDKEIQAWASALATERRDGGYGLKGIPLTRQGSKQKLATRDDLVLMVTCVIFTCSVQHAAVNFPQYDHFSYAPNYPTVLLEHPPTNKTPRKEDDITRLLADRKTHLKMMQTIRTLSERGSVPLGTLTGSFIVDPTAVALNQEFRDKLDTIEKAIVARETRRKSEGALPAYDYLRPSLIPNSISI